MLFFIIKVTPRLTELKARIFFFFVKFSFTILQRSYFMKIQMTQMLLFIFLSLSLNGDLPSLILPKPIKIVPLISVELFFEKH
jgi:hypothetical protein